MDDFEVKMISDYLVNGIYPSGMTRDDKRSLRQKSTCFVCHTDGTLYHRGKEGRHQIIITDALEKQRIMFAVHTELGSRRVDAHKGMNSTIQKVSERYWWRHLVDDIRSFCKSCTTCRKLSYKFSVNPPVNDVKELK